jgi:hypothetical protein
MPILIGGDTSVMWSVTATKVKSTATQSIGDEHTQEGVAESAIGSFSITIQLPTKHEARKTFLEQFTRISRDRTTAVVLELPIEDVAYLHTVDEKDSKDAKNAKNGIANQIKIDWPPAPAGKTGR